MKPKDMDLKYIEDNLLIERYLRGELSRDEREAFEERFLASPQLLDQLEAAERLQQGLQDRGAVKVLEPAGNSTGRDRSRAIMPRFAMAASVLLAVSLGISGTLYVENLELTREASDLAAVPAQAQLVPLLTTRGASSVSHITLEPGAGQLVLLLDSALQPFRSYRATITRAGHDATIFEFAGLQPGYQEMIALSLPTNQIGPGEYRVELQGMAAESTAPELVSQLTFTIR